MPIPPSNNELHSTRRFKDKKGNWNNGGHRNSAVYKEYLLEMQSWANKHHLKVAGAKAQLLSAIKTHKYIRTDLYICQPFKDFIASTGRPVGVDANNYPKACLDSIKKILSIDDAYYLSGFYEKVSTLEDPCAMMIITTHHVRSLQTIRAQIQRETSAYALR